MTTMNQNFQRARSTEAKEQREAAILEAARALAANHGVRQITLTDLADAVGMPRSFNPLAISRSDAAPAD